MITAGEELVVQLKHEPSNYPATIHVLDNVLAAWPEHKRYLARSFGARNLSVWQTAETLSRATLVLVGDRLPEIAENYRWTCDRLREEELHFHRTGKYRLSTFEEADSEVYSNSDYMKQYVDGLLLSQLLWFNHTASCEFFISVTRKLLPARSRMLEVGPGHGLMTYLAMRDFDLASCTAWDISEVSIEQTRTALQKLGSDGVEFDVRDLTTVEAGPECFDFIVLSEVLEHLEAPLQALDNIRSLLRPQGFIFVNVPINSPSPDHLYLMTTIEEAKQLLESTGYSILELGVFPSQGEEIDRAIRKQMTVSVCMFAQKNDMTINAI